MGFLISTTDMIIERFEDILAWRRAKELTVEIKAVFRNCRDSEYCRGLWAKDKQRTGTIPLYR